MALLGELGVVQRRVRRFEIGATVLLVGIEEEGIKAAIEIVMVRDVVQGLAARIELLGMPDEVTQTPLQLGPARQYFGLIHQDRQCIRNRAILDDEGSVHVDFAERKFRVEQNPAFGLGGQEPDPDRFPGPVAAAEFRSTRGREGHRAAADELLQEVTQQTIHRNHQTERSQRGCRSGHHTRRKRGSIGPPAPRPEHNSDGARALVRCTQSGYSEVIPITRLRYLCASIRGIIG